VPKLRASMWY